MTSHFAHTLEKFTRVVHRPQSAPVKKITPVPVTLVKTSVVIDAVEIMKKILVQIFEEFPELKSKHLPYMKDMTCIYDFNFTSFPNREMDKEKLNKFKECIDATVSSVFEENALVGEMKTDISINGRIFYLADNRKRLATN